MTWCVREQLLTTATDGAQLSSIPSHPCLEAAHETRKRQPNKCEKLTRVWKSFC
ncbi:hypothetical protein ABLN64_04230 [Mycobacterium tuberculosis]